MMRRLLFLLLLLPSAAWADPPVQPPDPPCEVAGAQALAKAKGIALKDLPGIDGTTKLALRIHNGAVSEPSVRISSGNDELDEVLKTCELRREPEPNAYYTSFPSYEWKKVLQPPSDTSGRPRPNGPDHSCMKNMPSLDQLRNRDGVATGVLFEVTATGAVEAIIVSASSGYLEFDLATTRCASKWLYDPAIKADGTPVAVRWQSTINYFREGRGNIDSPVPLDNSSCVKEFPDAAKRAMVSKSSLTVVRYTLKDGEVTNVEAVPNSGDAILDGYALSCVTLWKFKPQFASGRPANGTYTAIIDWPQKTLP